MQGGTVNKTSQFLNTLHCCYNLYYIPEWKSNFISFYTSAMQSFDLVTVLCALFEILVYQRPIYAFLLGSVLYFTFIERF